MKPLLRFACLLALPSFAFGEDWPPPEIAALLPQAKDNAPKSKRP